jgi:tetratricopeptide (TPR) repeat protein
VLLAVAVDQRHDVKHTLRHQARAFTQVGAVPGADSSTRLASGAGNRYDYWRIAWHAFEDRPLLGAGAGNYDRVYFQRRATEEDVRQPHSLALQAAAELGLPGVLALLLAFAGAILGAWRLARAAAASAADRFLAVAATGCFTAWLVHANVDWTHLLPGVTGIALVAAAVLVRDRTPVAAPSPLRAARRPRLAPAAVVAVGLALAAIGLSRQGLSEHYRAEGREALAAQPAEALLDADRSLRLDPEAVDAYYLKAAALARFGEAAAARAALTEAARREPREYVTWALLGDLAVRTGDLGRARSHYRRALALNPRDPGLRQSARDPAAGRR